MRKKSAEEVQLEEEIKDLCASAVSEKQAEEVFEEARDSEPSPRIEDEVFHSSMEASQMLPPEGVLIERIVESDQIEEAKPIEEPLEDFGRPFEEVL